MLERKALAISSILFTEGYVILPFSTIRKLIAINPAIFENTSKVYLGFFGKAGMCYLISSYSPIGA